MSVMRFSDLPAANQLNDNDIIAVTQNGTSKQATIGQIDVGGGGGSSPHSANELINGDMRLSQRGAWFDDLTQITSTDATYLVDRWCHLSDGDNAWLVQSDNLDPPPNGNRSYAMMNLSADVQAGVYQAIDFERALRLRGQTVSVSLLARTGSGFNDHIDTMRAAILTRNGVKNSFARDIITTWGASGVEPTWADDWIRAGEILEIDLTTARETWLEFNLDGVALPSDITNLAVVIWIDDATIAQYDFCQLAKIKLEVAATATPFYPRPIGAQASLANQYALAVNKSVIGWANSSSTVRAAIDLPSHLQKTPTVTAPVAITASQYNSTYSQSAPDITLIRHGHQSVVIELGGFSGLTLDGPVLLPDTDDPWVIFEAEL
jgi:hypothetical protein